MPLAVRSCSVSSVVRSQKHSGLLLISVISARSTSGKVNLSNILPQATYAGWLSVAASRRAMEVVRAPSAPSSAEARAARGAPGAGTPSASSPNAGSSLLPSHTKTESFIRSVTTRHIISVLHISNSWTRHLLLTYLMRRLDVTILGDVPSIMFTGVILYHEGYVPIYTDIHCYSLRTVKWGD